MAYQLLCGGTALTTPFEAVRLVDGREHVDSDANLRRVAAYRGALAFPKGCDVSAGMRAFIARMLQAGPRRRPSARELLQDPWWVRSRGARGMRLGVGAGNKVLR